MDPKQPEISTNLSFSSYHYLSHHMPTQTVPRCPPEVVSSCLLEAFLSGAVNADLGRYKLQILW